MSTPYVHDRRRHAEAVAHHVVRTLRSKGWIERHEHYGNLVESDVEVGRVPSSPRGWQHGSAI